MNTLQKSTHLWKTRLAPLAAPFGAAALRASARSFLFLALLAASFSAAPPAHAAGLSLPPNNLGLVGYWSFNEGSGSIAHDFSGNGNTGTLVNSPTWTTGKLGQALSFNGTSQYVNLGNSAPLQITGVITLSAWVNVSSFPAIDTGVEPYGNGYIIGKGYDSTYEGYYLRIFHKSDGTYHLQSGSYGGGTNSNTDWTFSTGTWKTGTWHHVVGLYDGSNWKLYFDGVAVSSTAAAYGALTTAKSAFIGATDIAGTIRRYFTGTIDDVRVYNRALGAAEVQALYKSGLAKLNASHNNQLTNGLVGLWSFDGADMSGTTAYDRSGSGNNGTLVGGPVPTIGRLGQALSFNGTSQYITAGSSSVFDFTSSPFTLSAWIYPTSLSNGPVPFYKGRYRSNGYYAQILSTGEVDFLTNQSGSNQLSKTNTGSIVTGKWQLLTITRSGTSVRIYVNGIDKTTTAGSHSDPVSSSDTFAVNTYNYAGYQNTYIMSGSIDDVRIYNRALSQADVTQLYDMGAGTHINVSQNNIPGSTLQSGLVGLWSFDGPDLTTTTAYDRSGQGNNGTLTNGPTPAIGKLGQALSFNGTSQYVTTSTLTGYSGGQITFSAWFKPSVVDGTQNIVLDGNGDGHIRIEINATNNIDIGVGDGGGWSLSANFVSTSYTVSAGTWYNVVGLWDGTYIKLYVNGAFVGKIAWGGTPSSMSGVTIGDYSITHGTYNFPGTLDDVRIYNRALSASEVKQLYNLGR